MTFHRSPPLYAASRNFRRALLCHVTWHFPPYSFGALGDVFKLSTRPCLFNLLPKDAYMWGGDSDLSFQLEKTAGALAEVPQHLRYYRPA